MSHRVLHVPSLLVGVVGLAVVAVSMSQVAPPMTSSWGPPKKGVVNIFNNPGGFVPAGGSTVVYQVPSDRWLTVTSASTYLGGGCLCGGWPCLRWAEQLGGVVTEKAYAGNSPFVAQGEVGWVFRPGSQVVISNVDVSPCYFERFSLIGYETRE